MFSPNNWDEVQSERDRIAALYNIRKCGHGGCSAGLAPLPKGTDGCMFGHGLCLYTRGKRACSSPQMFCSVSYVMEFCWGSRSLALPASAWQRSAALSIKEGISCCSIRTS